MAAARLSCLARNGRTGVPARSFARGGKPRGRKSHRRHCGSGDRGVAGLRPDQANERPGASRTLNSILETCQLAIGPHKRSRVPGEVRDNLARGKAAPRRRNRPNPTRGRVTAGSQSSVETPISSEAREGPRGPRHAEEGLPRRSESNRRWSLRVTCSWRLPPWAAEVGPAQHHFSRSGVPHYRHARPGGTTDGDGTDDGKRLAPPFRGNTDMGKRESRIIAGTCRGKRK